MTQPSGGAAPRDGMLIYHERRHHLGDEFSPSSLITEITREDSLMENCCLFGGSETAAEKKEKEKKKNSQISAKQLFFFLAN